MFILRQFFKTKFEISEHAKRAAPNNMGFGKRRNQITTSN